MRRPNAQLDPPRSQDLPAVDMLAMLRPWAHVHLHLLRLPSLCRHRQPVQLQHTLELKGPRGLGCRGTHLKIWLGPASAAGAGRSGPARDVLCALRRLYNEAKAAGLFMQGQEAHKAPMFSAIMHMFARAQRFDMVHQLVQDVQTFSVHIKMNTLVVRPPPCALRDAAPLLGVRKPTFSVHLQMNTLVARSCATDRGCCCMRWHNLHAAGCCPASDSLSEALLLCSANLRTACARVALRAARVCTQMCLLHAVLSNHNDLVYELLVNIRGQHVGGPGLVGFCGALTGLGLAL